MAAENSSESNGGEKNQENQADERYKKAGTRQASARRKGRDEGDKEERKERRKRGRREAREKEERRKEGREEGERENSGQIRDRKGYSGKDESIDTEQKQTERGS